MFCTVTDEALSNAYYQLKGFYSYFKKITLEAWITCNISSPNFR